jgi:hypothetical protein
MQTLRRRWLTLITALSGAVLLLSVLGVLASIAAIERGLVRGPDVNLTIGSYRLIARATDRPECLPLTVHECFVSFPTASVSAPRYYAIWLGQVRFIPTSSSEGRVTVSRGWHLLQLRLR